MFRKSTVFVLGAGASWHYGYPTGEDLVTRIIEKATELALYFKASFESGNGNFPTFVLRNESPGTRSRVPWNKAWEEANELAVRLKQVNPTLIDYFLAHNSDLHDIGRLVIAMVIFECEYDFHRLDGNKNHLALHRRRVDQGLVQPSTHFKVNAFDDDWLRFVLYKLTVGCKTSAELLENNVHFVTFNYDTSLERRLYYGLLNISHFTPKDIDEFMWNDRIFHMYGRVRNRIDKMSEPLVMSIPTRGDPIDAERILDVAFVASRGIHTIDGDDKVRDAEIIAKSKSFIQTAETVYILGFGFDASNVTRSGLDGLGFTDVLGRNVFFTNFGGHNRVGAAAGRALLKQPGAFGLPNGSNIQERYYNNLSFKYQMSVKNVYDALSQDFESLEAD